jgi:hypothetical protein
VTDIRIGNDEFAKFDPRARLRSHVVILGRIWRPNKRPLYVRKFSQVRLNPGEITSPEGSKEGRRW